MLPLHEVGRKVGRPGLGITDYGALLMHQVGVKMKHQRRLELAGMAHAAVLRFAGGHDLLAGKGEIA